MCGYYKKILSASRIFGSHPGQNQELLDSALKILQHSPAADICLHYSLKNMPPGMKNFREFLKSGFLGF